MKMPFPSLNRLVIGTVTAVSICFMLLPKPSLAQANNDVNPLQDFQPKDDSSDPFSSRNGDTTGIFDLIHRATLGGNRSIDDFAAEQDENLNSAAADFRAKQRALIQGQQQALPANSVNTTPQAGN